MRPKIRLPTYNIEAGSDGTGFKSGNAWDRTFVYGNLRRKYVKVIITAEIKSKKLIAVYVKIGEVSEPKGSCEAHRAVKRKWDKVLRR